MSSHLLTDHAFAKLRHTGGTRHLPCKICEGDAELYDIVDFNKACTSQPYALGLSGVPVAYRKCIRCDFIFTDFFDDFSSEQWQQFVYNEDYVKVDPEYVEIRPQRIARLLGSFLFGQKSTCIGLDYGGGNGKTTQLLRSRGWSFDCYDPFGHTDMRPERRGQYNFCCAIEVFEHSPDPVRSLRSILEVMSSEAVLIMIGTALHDGEVLDGTRLSWWYAAPRNGHISLHSSKAFEVLARTFGLTYVSAGNPHFEGNPNFLARGVDAGTVRRRLLQTKVLRRLSAMVPNG